ncbi:hypothetical protein [Nocardia sp. NPDC051570]|uniref:hypothetical protein n=1 Tax=Nocardia sp. NPDC051570 TaxID=3364324 RepID=UPI0037BBDFB8
MIAVRIILLALGIGAAGYGIRMLLEQNPDDLRSVVIWFAGGIILHDFVFAPICAAVGVGARRLVPAAWWASVVYGGICSIALIAVALPVVDREHALATNSTVLDRPYGIGLLLALAVVWLLVALHLIVRASARRRRLYH